jgi:nonspecific dipeptidase
MHRWRFPSLSLHGIQGAFSEPGAKTVIPAKLIGKFSVRIVPDQTPEKIKKLVQAHLENMWSKRGSSNSMKVREYTIKPCFNTTYCLMDPSEDQHNSVP